MKSKAKQLRRSIRRYILTMDSTINHADPYDKRTASISATNSYDYISKIAMLCYWGDRFTCRISDRCNPATRSALHTTVNILLSCYHNMYGAEK